MIKKIIINSAIIAVVSGALVSCSSTVTPVKHQQLKLTENELASAKWQTLKRLDALYPIEAARQGEEGCATIEYVITPDYQIEDVKIVAASKHYFGKTAKNAVKNWQWQQLTPGIITTAVKTQTRIDFCVQWGDKSCETVSERLDCPGQDLLFTTANRVKYRH